MIDTTTHTLKHETRAKKLNNDRGNAHEGNDDERLLRNGEITNTRNDSPKNRTITDETITMRNPRNRKRLNQTQHTNNEYDTASLTNPMKKSKSPLCTTRNKRYDETTNAWTETLERKTVRSTTITQNDDHRRYG